MTYLFPKYLVQSINIEQSELSCHNDKQHYQHHMSVYALSGLMCASRCSPMTIKVSIFCLNCVSSWIDTAAKQIILISDTTLPFFPFRRASSHSDQVQWLDHVSKLPAGSCSESVRFVCRYTQDERNKGFCSKIELHSATVQFHSNHQSLDFCNGVLWTSHDLNTPTAALKGRVWALSHQQQQAAAAALQPVHFGIQKAQRLLLFIHQAQHYAGHEIHRSSKKPR